MSKRHRNSHENKDEHHLYAIWDEEEEDILKYGISSDPIGDDGLSRRVRNQVNLYNAIAGFLRFFGKILVTGINGRKQAEEIENEYVEEYKKKNGRKPRANRK